MYPLHFPLGISACLRVLPDQLSRDHAGVTALEYAIIASMVAIVIVSSLRVLGTTLSNTFATIASTL